MEKPLRSDTCLKKTTEKHLVCDNKLSNHRSQEPVKCDSYLSNLDSTLSGYDTYLSYKNNIGVYRLLREES